MKGRFMHWVVRYARSSIGQKQIMGLCGLALMGFLVVHLGINSIHFFGGKYLNMFSHYLVNFPLVIPAEIILAGIFLLHIVGGIYLQLQNMKARKTSYQTSLCSPQQTLSTRWPMIVSGIFILIFLVTHVMGTKFGVHYDIQYGEMTIRDLMRLTVEMFQKPQYLAWYLFNLVNLAIHLNHGFWSVFQTFGLDHPKYTPLIKWVGRIFALLVSAGFIVVMLSLRSQGVS
jgi:succinate dehydrogenase / fumarate reductase cytochrome b subunit